MAFDRKLHHQKIPGFQFKYTPASDNSLREFADITDHALETLIRIEDIDFKLTASLETIYRKGIGRILNIFGHLEQRAGINIFPDDTSLVPDGQETHPYSGPDAMYDEVDFDVEKQMKAARIKKRILNMLPEGFTYNPFLSSFGIEITSEENPIDEIQRFAGWFQGIAEELPVVVSEEREGPSKDHQAALEARRNEREERIARRAEEFLRDKPEPKYSDQSTLPRILMEFCNTVRHSEETREHIRSEQNFSLFMRATKFLNAGNKINNRQELLEAMASFVSTESRVR